ncbi:MAG: hypothetical protein L0Y37_06130 [Bacteroidales bacterium]|nr:hypothetical protein [Bacteroidales bacterium]
MKTKIIVTAISTLAIAAFAKASEMPVSTGDEVYSSGGQQVVVNNYYSSYGYEYASRLRRFHNTYIAFDFYSPVYTEVYWYNYTPGTRGNSTGQGGTDRDKSNNAKPKDSGSSAPSGTVSRQQTQSAVKTTSVGNRRSTEKSSEQKSSGDEKSQKENSSSGRRL